MKPESTTFKALYILYLIALLATVGLVMIGIARAQSDTVAQNTRQDEMSSTNTPQTNINAGISPTTTNAGTGVDTTTPLAQAYTPAPVVLDIASDGTTLIRGIVTEVGTDMVKIDTWGGTWTVRMNSDGITVPGNTLGTGYNLTAIQRGHFIGAEGKVSQTDDFTVNASFMRDWTTNPYTGEGAVGAVMGGSSSETPYLQSPGMPTDIGGGTGASATGTGNLGTTSDLTSTTSATTTMETSWRGEIDSINGNSITFTDGNDTFTKSDDVQYTIDIGNAALTDEDGKTIQTSDIDRGNNVVIYGTKEGNTITPSRIEVDTSFLF